MTRTLTCIALLSAGGPAGLGGQVRPAAPPQAVAPGDWAFPSHDLAATRFSPLNQLTARNVAGLKLLWSYSTGSLKGHEGNPLVVGGRLYLHTPHPTVVVAFNLEDPDAPVLWRYAPQLRDTALSLCCDVGSRGLAWHPAGRLYVPLFPGDLAAVDTRTGREIWRVRNGNPRLGVTMQAAPLVVGDVVIVGVGGGEFGARGYLTAYDAANGRLLWRAYSTGPDTETLAAGPANVSYPSHQDRGLGTGTWQGDGWARGGGATWGWLTYDPDLDLVYYGTGAPAPLNASQRPGDNKWTSSILARELKTGKLRWALQLTPHDPFGYDGSNENILADLTVAGRPVKALVHFDRNGFAYTLDRTTGRLVVAEKYGPANWATGVDLGSGLPALDPKYVGAEPKTGVCPSLMGMKTFQPAAFSPVTRLFYVPVNNLCMDFQPTVATFAPGQPYLGATVRLTPGPGGNRGRFIAWDAVTGSIAWEAREAFPVFSGVVATAGGVVFYGTLDGWLKAVDATTGQLLWRFRTPSGIVGNPITFAGPDGRQYVAVVSGVGGWPALGLLAGATSKPSDGLGAVGAFADLVRYTNPGGVLLVFGL